MLPHKMPPAEPMPRSVHVECHFSHVVGAGLVLDTPLQEEAFLQVLGRK
jgi:hypothetical protein